MTVYITIYGVVK